MSKEINKSRSPATSATASDAEYKVGPGRPPREYQFKPGQSGNPKGAKRKPPSVAPDLKAALERALNKTIKLRQGEKEREVSMAAAGIEQLVAQYVRGDHRARRDLIALADKLGVDLMAGQQQALQEALTADHEAILLTYVERQYDKVFTPAPVFAPPELLDDDPQDQNQD
jgi:3-oxoacyl-ACP reductase-like protein